METAWLAGFLGMPTKKEKERLRLFKEKYPAETLRRRGFTARTLRSEGFTVEECGVAGCGASEMQAAGFALKDFGHFYSGLELRAAGKLEPDVNDEG